LIITASRELTGVKMFTPSRMLLIFVAILIVAETRVYAYTDPGSGALIWQILVAACFGVMFYVRRIMNWFRRLKTRKGHTLDKAFDVETESESVKG
jgi:hypothetical protein